MTFDEYKESVKGIEFADYASLLNIGRKWKKIDDKEYNLKVAFLGSASIQLLTSVTRALLSKYDIYPEVYEGEYNGILMDVMDNESQLYKFNPEYIVIIPDYRDIVDQKPGMMAGRTEVLETVEKTVKNYLKIVATIHEKLPGSQIIFSNFVVPYYGALGNLEVNYVFSQKYFLELVNLTLIEQKPSYVMLIDMDGLANYIGKEKWFDDSAYCLSKSSFSLSYVGFVSDLIARQFEGFIGKPKKCLALDLDNTLWGGVVGDLGYDGINIDPNDAEGEAYLQFQKYLLEMKNRGIILAVCSKNDLNNAKEPFEKNENMILKLKDISCFVANWNDKASNLRLIARELNIGIDSIVFFDDNPTERVLVQEFAPEVRVIDVPEDPALYVRTLDQAHAFEWNQITNEDISRVKSYSDNVERNNLLETCVNYEEYLKKLEMCIKIEPVNDTTLTRFSQLTNKSNQFNFRTQRYSEAEISMMMQDKQYELLTVSLQDKFSNYGIIACVVLRFSEDECFIENWVMSCRVLKKSVENYTIEKIVNEAKRRNATSVRSEYIKSKKNNMVSDLYETFGFDKIFSDDDKSQYVLELNKIINYKQTYYFKED